MYILYIAILIPCIYAIWAICNNDLPPTFQTTNAKLSQDLLSRFLLPGSLFLVDLQPHRMPAEARLASGEWRNIEASASVVPKVLQKLLARSGSESWVSSDIVRHGKGCPSFSLQIMLGSQGFWSDFTLKVRMFFRNLATTYCNTSPSTQRNKFEPLSSWLLQNICKCLKYVFAEDRFVSVGELEPKQALNNLPCGWVWLAMRTWDDHIGDAICTINITSCI